MTGRAPAKVVALLGVSGSGKSIVARRLTETHGFTRIRFGDPIRDMLAAGFGLTEDDLDGEGKNQPLQRFGGHTPLNLVHSLSHDWARRTIHSDLIVNEWCRRAAAVGGFILSDDLQRPNEAAAVRQLGGVVVRITRPGFVPANEGSLHRQARVASDLELVNEGPSALAALADEFAKGLVAAAASAA